jgi:6-phosphogluconolactonase
MKCAPCSPATRLIDLRGGLVDYDGHGSFLRDPFHRCNRSKVVLAANYGTGSCTSIPIKPDGSLGEPASVHQHKGKSINPDNQQGPHAHSINVDKANTFAFCADLSIDKVMVYRLDANTGKLTPNDPPAFVTPPGTGPRHFAFHPDGKTAYINGEINLTLIACDYDESNSYHLHI